MAGCGEVSGVIGPPVCHRMRRDDQQCAGRLAPVENAGCKQSIAAKNVSAANNGFSLIREAIHASVTVPRFAVKKSGKPPVKSAGWPDLKIAIIGADRNGSKTPKIGA